MKDKKKYVLLAGAVAALCAVCIAAFSACSDDSLQPADYSDLSNNSYAVTQSTTADYKLFMPEARDVKYKTGYCRRSSLSSQPRSTADGAPDPCMILSHTDCPCSLI